MLSTMLLAAHCLAEGFLPRGHVLRCEVGAVASASRPIPRPRPAGATVAYSASARLIPRRGASSSDQALVEYDRLQSMRPAISVHLAERVLRIKASRSDDVSNRLNGHRGNCRPVAAWGKQQRTGECEHAALLPAARKWRHAKIRLKKAKFLSQCRKNLRPNAQRGRKPCRE